MLPWLAKNMLLVVLGVFAGFYSIYVVTQQSATEDEASFWGSLTGLFWVILGKCCCEKLDL
jgi:hypothetical protein